MYRAFGYAHATLYRIVREVRGQGTVEYVALILLVALVMAGVVAAMKGYKTDEGMALGDAIIGKIKDVVAEYAASGIDLLVLMPEVRSLRQLELLSEHVLPEYRH